MTGRLLFTGYPGRRYYARGTILGQKKKKRQGDTLYRSELANVMKKEGGSQTKVGGF